MKPLQKYEEIVTLADSKQFQEAISEIFDAAQAAHVPIPFWYDTFHLIVYPNGVVVVQHVHELN